MKRCERNYTRRVQSISKHQTWADRELSLVQQRPAQASVEPSRGGAKTAATSSSV